MTVSRPRLYKLRTQLLSLLAIIITLCILLTWLVYTKLGLNQYFITNKDVNIPSWANSVFDEQSIAKSSSRSSIISPACKPHFNLALSNGNWSSTTKFKRLYFYHVRKAGGTNLRRYFEKIAKHHGLQFKVIEYEMAEDPSTNDEATFYVTHMREPVSRSISSFKYEGRWDCDQLVKNRTFIPTKQNAQSITNWDRHFGFDESWCSTHITNSTSKPKIHKHFRMGKCAVNCYSQWFAGTCPWWTTPKHPGPNSYPIRREIPMTQQYQVAKKKLFNYNAIIIMEKLQDKQYVQAMERFFGVPGIDETKFSPWCQAESHYVNQHIPLTIDNSTYKRLTVLNKLDKQLYHEISDCLEDEEVVDNIPSWDSTRFEMNETIQLNHTHVTFPCCYNLPMEFKRRFNNSMELTKSAEDEEGEVLSSPVCKPHFQLALPNGTWTTNIKFKRLYFYHSRKAGGTNLKRYLQKVTAHHGLKFKAEEFTVAEEPGSRQDTFYVTHMREPVARSISHFKYEGRWNCQQVINNSSFIPTLENSRSLESWSENDGRLLDGKRSFLCAVSKREKVCKKESNGKERCGWIVHKAKEEIKGEGLFEFYMTTCATECYIQWMSGLSCPFNNRLIDSISKEEMKIGKQQHKVPWYQQYEAARKKLKRYNAVIITEMLQDEKYVAALERFFGGVPGIGQRNLSPWCEPESHYLNERFPLEIKNKTMKILRKRNQFDTMLYDEMKDCLIDGEYNFPAWDATRFEVMAKQVDYKEWERINRPRKADPSEVFLQKIHNNTL